MKRPKKRHSFFRRLIVPLLIEAVVDVLILALLKKRQPSPA